MVQEEEEEKKKKNTFSAQVCLKLSNISWGTRDP